eukprot:IDg20624t1
MCNGGAPPEAVGASPSARQLVARKCTRDAQTESCRAESTSEALLALSNKSKANARKESRARKLL